MRLSLVTPPAAEPVTTEQALDHLRLPHDHDDRGMVESFVSAARQYVESAVRRQLLTATWKLYANGFPAWRWQPLELPLPPLLTVTHVKYLDTAGVLQTWDSANYVVDKPAGPQALEGRIYPALNVEWPTDVGLRLDAVEIEYTAGYGADETTVPAALKQAMLLLVGDLYENRESAFVGVVHTANPAVDRLLAPFTRWSEAIR